MSTGIAHLFLIRHQPGQVRLGYLSRSRTKIMSIYKKTLEHLSVMPYNRRILFRGDHYHDLATHAHSPPKKQKCQRGRIR